MIGKVIPAAPMFVTFEQWLSAEAFSAILVFARVGMVFMLLPGIGEVYVSSRIRLLLAGTMVLLLVPVIRPGLPAEPDGRPRWRHVRRRPGQQPRQHGGAAWSEHDPQRRGRPHQQQR